MILHTPTRRKRISTLVLSLGMVCVWLLGARAALSTSIYSAKHACCHKEKLADSCLTLCASAQWTATASAEQVQSAPPLVAVWLTAVQQASAKSDVLVETAAANHSPPLYLQHSSLLI